MEAISQLPLRPSRTAVSAIFFLAGLTFSSWASRIPDIKEALRLSEAGLGLLLFALPVGQMISMPLAAPLIARLGSRRVMCYAAVLYPLTLVLLPFVASVYFFAAVLALFGFLASVLNIAMNTQAVAVEALYGRAIMGSFHGLWSVGGFSGALLGGLAISMRWAPSLHFSTVLAICILATVAAYTHTVASDRPSAGNTRFFGKWDRQLLLLGFIGFCCLVCEGAMADWSGVYFRNEVRGSGAVPTIGYIAFTSTMALGRFLGDGLITRYGTANILRWSGLLIVLGLGIAIGVPSLVPAIIGFLLIGFGVSSIVPLAFSLAGRSETISASAALAVVSSISFLGFLAGPPLIGFIAEASSLKLSFAFVALLGLGPVLLAGKVKGGNGVGS